MQNVDKLKAFMNENLILFFYTGQSYIGDACAVNSDCVTLNAECRYGQCLCVPGYSFSPAERQCTHGKLHGQYGEMALP